MIFILLLCLIIILLFNIKKYKCDFIAPAIVFVFSFTFSTFVCSLYWENWEANISLKTFLVILTGNIIFSLVCMLFYKKPEKEQEINIVSINYNKIFAIAFFLLGLVTIYLTAKFVTSYVGMNLSQIKTALYKYRDKATFRDENVSLPFYLNLLTGVMHAGGLWFIYVLLNNYFAKKKIEILLLANIILCFISTFMEGSRSMGINYILFTICNYVYFVNLKYNFNKSIGIKQVIKIMSLGILILIFFKYSATLIGRNNINSYSSMDYVALYTGAEIKNLDTFLKTEDVEYKYGIYTFSSISSILTKIFNYDNSTNFPFRSVNGYNLGNVYTIFYHFYNDLGFTGIIIYSAFMAFIAQSLYNNSKKIKDTNVPNVNVLIYCYSFSGIFYSFFSNHFFGLIFSTGFIKYLILWLIFNKIMVKNVTKEKNLNSKK